ncbi:MAG: class I SAM-dependent methyltransferase family protein [Euryarchaeota archaeon]|nr:class I SAM-dependent methyltransferase family protein [Euryarchaeota archaeon]
MNWKIVGDILVLKDETNNIDEILNLPNVSTVVKLKSINGFKRTPQVEILKGDSTETIHKENKCLFKLDVSKVMWSKGNTSERMRIGHLVEDGETVVDMFAGIGYFSIPIAVHSNPRKVYSIEINSVAYSYLTDNIKLNKVEDIVEPILGDCRDVTPKNVGDRVLMGYLPNAHEYLDVAIGALKDGGIIHYHESVPEKIKFKRPINMIKNVVAGRKIKILNKRVIKKYSPGVCHVVIDAMIE